MFDLVFQENTSDSSSESSLPSTLTTAYATSDSTYSVVPAEGYEKFSFYLNVAAVPAVCGVGFIANLLGISVLHKAAKLEKITIHVYLFFLTTLDAIFLLVGVIRTTPNFIHLFDKYLANAVEVYANLGFVYIDMVLTYSTSSVVVVMALERSIAIVRPFSLKTSWLTIYPRRILTLCVLGNALFLSPFPINFEVWSFQNFENRTEYVLRYKIYNVNFMDSYTMVHTVVNNYVPAIVLLGTTATMILFFSRFRQRHLSQNRQSLINRKQLKITATVLCITVFYFLFSIPDIFIKTRSYFDKDYSLSGKYRWSFWMLVDVSNMFSYLSAANDFVIYILVSDHFRNIFIDMFCIRVKKRNLQCAVITPDSIKISTEEMTIRRSPIMRHI